MNVALFHNDLPNPDEKPGGVSVVVHRLANALSEHPDANVTVFSLSKRPSTAQYHHVRLFPNKLWLRSKIAARFVLPLALNTVDFGDFDVLHLHGDDWFFVRRSVPSVRTFHGSALKEAQTAPTFKRWLNQYLIYVCEQLSARLATVSAGVGPEAASLYQSSEIVHNGVDTSLFQPDQKTEYPSILFVGTWSGRKRGKFLYNLFTKKVNKEVSRSKLFMVTEECKKHENVIHFKRPDDKKLSDLYSKSWVLAHPSVYEGFGVPYIEAMASGTSVVSSPNVGAKHVLSDGEYGVIADDNSFAQELIEILANEEKRRYYESRGIERSEEFTWKNVAKRHLEIYEKSIEISEQSYG